jgi:hypothetical protein
VAGKSSLTEIGRTGLLQSGGVLYEEFLNKLRGEQGRRVFREMADNDPVIGGILLAFEKSLARLPWKIEVPDDASPDDKAIAEFVQECFEDMSDSWDSTLSSLLSMLVFGWSFHEIVYKIRGGRDTKDPTHYSRFTDGKVGWRKWAIRAQDTLLRWEFDDTGGIQGMTQFVPGGSIYTIPIEKALLFRTTLGKNNPEGRAMIRNSFRPWFFKKKIEEIEAIGIERDLAGLPVAYLDPMYFSPTATPDEKNLFDQVQKIVTQIKRNEAEGVVFPRIYDENNNSMIELSLLSTGGARQFDTDKIITRYNQQIAMSVLADFIMLGHEQVGTQSLGASKIELWMMAVEAIAKQIAATVNQHAIPRLLRLNGMDAENPPELVFGAVEQVDLTGLGQFLSAMVTAGLIVPDVKLEEMLRELAHLTPIDEESREDMGSTDQIPLGANDIAALVAQGARNAADGQPGQPGQPGVPPKPAVAPGTNPAANAAKPAGAPLKAPARIPPKPAKAPAGAK